MNATRRSLLAALAAAPCLAGAQAGDARRYGVISAMGDRMTLVVYQGSTGTQLDRNERRSVPIGSTELDDAALLAVRSGLPPASAETTAFYRVAPDQFPRWQAIAETGKVAMPVDVADALKRDGVTHLVLVTKLRAPAAVELWKQRIGAGNLEGVGFYLDPEKEMMIRETGVREKGYVAPYVYVQLVLVDVAAERVAGRESVKVARAYTSGNAAARFDPWASLSPQQKIQLIRDAIANDVKDAAVRLVAG